jgi:DNA-binding transcriptional MerR regulator
MSFTINKLAKLAGVSVRTLHYYDAIGLLKPSRVGENSYRYYEEADLSRLQQILFFRELDFPLEKIKEIMHAQSYSPLEALEEQKQLLEIKKKHVEGLLATITQTIRSMKGGESMSNDDKFSAFNDPTYQQHKDEAEKRWGLTDAYKQSMERVGKMTKADLEAIKAEQEDYTQKLAMLFTRGAAVDSVEVQDQVDRHYKQMCRFYDPSYEMYKGLGQMYVQDPRFTATYDAYVHGLAVFLRDAMTVYADVHLK